MTTYLSSFDLVEIRPNTKELMEVKDAKMKISVDGL
jgi:hypothetical protein